MGILRGSLCQWLDRARFRWSCLFENCKHAQTHPVEPYSDRERRQSSNFCEIGICILTSKARVKLRTVTATRPRVEGDTEFRRGCFFGSRYCPSYLYLFGGGRPALWQSRVAD